jgi:Carbohydrate phosphorylase
MSPMAVSIACAKLAMRRLIKHLSSPVTPRRWLDQCNPGLSSLITETLKIPKTVWLKDLYKLEGLLDYAEDPKFQKKWAAVKQTNKERLARYVEAAFGVKVNTRAMFDVQVKVRYSVVVCRHRFTNVFSSDYTSIRFASHPLSSIQCVIHYVQRQTLNIFGVIHVSICCLRVRYCLSYTFFLSVT